MTVQDSFGEEIKKEIQEGFIKQIADKIVQGMASLDNATEDVKRRWIWELLQNAKDVPNRFGGVSVIIELYEDKLLFKHNGDCFTIKNLTSLIQQVSSKDDQGKDPNVTGKFGTGFITTHLLSRKFTIRGVAKSQSNCCKKFTMIVDRDASNSHDMIEKIKIALDELCDLTTKESVENYEENRTEDDMDTEFEYPLTSETYESAEVGVKDLLKVLPYSLLFIPLLKKATVFIHSKNGYQKFLVKRNGKIQGEGIEIITIAKNEQNFKDGKEVKSQTENSTFIMNSKEGLNIVWPIQQTEDRTKILKISMTLPKLFCSFPLIGSETFFQPMVVNSAQFFPNEPRNTIFLRNPKSEQVKKNRELLVNANYLFKELVTYGIQNKFEDFFNLFSEKPLDNPYIDLRWVVDSAHDPRRKFLLSEPLVKTVNGTQASVKSMFFPKAASSKLRQELWELYRKYFHDNIVILEELEKWYEVLNATIYALDIEQFTKRISESKCLSNMDQFDDDESRINFINELISFVKRSGENDFKSKVSLSDNPIIPNIKGFFKPHKRLLSDREKPIPEEIKLIYSDVFESSLDDVLIHHSIKLKLSPYQSYNTQKALDDINNQLSTFKDKDLKNDISLKLSELVPYEENNNESTRLQIIHFLNDLKFNVKIKIMDELPKDTWRFSDQIVFELMLQKLIYFGKSTSPKPVDYLSQTIGKDIDGTMEWMNRYITFMRNVGFNKVISVPIIPRQDSFFGLLTLIYIDEDIPQTIKNILSNGNYDIYGQLIDKRITCFQGHQKMDIIRISDEIYHQLDMSDPVPIRRGRNITLAPRKNPADVYEIAIKLICLQSEKENGNELRKKFFQLIQQIDFSELIPQIRPIQIKEEFISNDILSKLDKCLNQASRFLSSYIIHEMTRKGQLAEIKDIFKSSFQMNGSISDWYCDFFRFMLETQQFRREIVSEKIILNQNGKFIGINDASIDYEHDENLLNISRNSLFNLDFKGVFIIPEIALEIDNFYNGLIKKVRAEDVAKSIDTKIKQYQGSKQDSSFVSLILEIRNLFDSDPKYKILLPYTASQMQQLIIDTLNSDTLSSIVSIVSEGKSEILTNLKNYDTNQVEQLMGLLSNGENINQSLTTVSSLNENDRQYLNEHPGILSHLIQNQRNNEEYQHQLEIMRQDRERRLREMQERLNSVRHTRVLPYTRPTFTNIRQYTHFTNINMNVRFEPPPPPQRSYEEKLRSSMESLLQSIFKKVKYEEPNIYYCSLIDIEEDENGDKNSEEYLIIPLIPDKENNIILDSRIIEFATDFPDTLILFEVPSEDVFDAANFKDSVKIITNIGIDLQDYNIVESVGELISINTDDFALKGCEKYFVQVKPNYINNNHKSFDEWSSLFDSNEEK